MTAACENIGSSTLPVYKRPVALYRTTSQLVVLPNILTLRVDLRLPTRNIEISVHT